MKLKLYGICALALLVASAACTKASPSRPSESTASSATTSVTDATTGVSLTSPSPVTPTANQQFKNVEQPITLTVKNAVTSGTTALVYTFEVATDSAFASKVYTKDGVPAGATTTALKIDKLTANKSYFWRARPERLADGSQYGGSRLRHRAGGRPESAGQRRSAAERDGRRAADAQRQQRGAQRTERPDLLPVRDFRNGGVRLAGLHRDRGGADRPVVHRSRRHDQAGGEDLLLARDRDRPGQRRDEHRLGGQRDEGAAVQPAAGDDPRLARQLCVLCRDGEDHHAGDGTERHQRRLHQEERT